MRAQLEKFRYWQWLVALLAATSPLYLFRLHFGPLPSTVWEVAFLVIFVLAIVGNKLDYKLARTSPFYMMIVTLLLVSLIALWVSPAKAAALGQWRAVILEPILFYWLAVSVIRTSDDYAIVIRYMIYFAALLGLQALIFTGHTTDQGRYIGLYLRDTGASPNYLALYLAPIVTMGSIWLVTSWANLKDRYLLAIALLASLAALVATQSRGGLIGLAAGGLLSLSLLFANKRPRQRKGIFATTLLIVVAALIVTLPSFLPDLSASQSTGGRLTSSNNVRYEIWRTTIRTIIPTAPVLGIGFANFQPLFTKLTLHWVNYPEYIAPLALHPHNFWLMTWVTLGIAGLAVWVWAAVIAIRKLMQPNPWQLALIAGFSAWFVQGLVDTTYYKNDLAIVFWILMLGLSIPSRRSD